MKIPLILLATAMLGGCISIGSDESDSGREEGRDIPIASVPPRVLAAARARVPGFVLKEAELRDRDDIRVYELDGTAGGEDCEIEVTPGGRVLEIDR